MPTVSKLHLIILLCIWEYFQLNAVNQHSNMKQMTIQFTCCEPDLATAVCLSIMCILPTVHSMQMLLEVTIALMLLVMAMCLYHLCMQECWRHGGGNADRQATF